MSKIGRKSLAVAFSAFAVAGVLSIPSPASAATCWASVKYGAWEHVSGTTWNRKWTWTFYNCASDTVRKKVIVNNGPDSVCHAIRSRGTGTHTMTESQTYGYHTNQYEKTVNC